MKTLLTDLDLSEVSLVDKGANPGAKIMLYKRDADHEICKAVAQAAISRSRLALAKHLGGGHDEKSHGNRKGGVVRTPHGSAYGSVDITEIREEKGRGGDVRIITRHGRKVLGWAEFDLRSSSYSAAVREDGKIKQLGVRSRNKKDIISAVIDYLTGAMD